MWQGVEGAQEEVSIFNVRNTLRNQKEKDPKVCHKDGST